MVKIVKNPGNGRLNYLNDPVLNVLKSNIFVSCVAAASLILTARHHSFIVWSFEGQLARTLSVEDEAL
jgi:hypothetical protein